MERNVDLPQPDGPETETYSPRLISTVTSDKARVSSSASSLLKTLVMPVSRMIGSPEASALSGAASCRVRRHHAILAIIRVAKHCRSEDVTNARVSIRYGDRALVVQSP